MAFTTKTSQPPHTLGPILGRLLNGRPVTAMTGHGAQQPPSPVLSGVGLANPPPNGPAFETGSRPSAWTLLNVLLGQGVEGRRRCVCVCMNMCTCATKFMLARLNLGAYLTLLRPLVQYNLCRENTQNKIHTVCDSSYRAASTVSASSASFWTLPASREVLSLIRGSICTVQHEGTFRCIACTAAMWVQ